MKRIGLIAAWVVVALATTAVAWQVVGAADDQVGNAPLTPLVASTTPASDDGTPSTGPGSTTPAGGSSTTVIPSGGSSTSTTTPRSTSTTASGPTSSTTTPGSTTPTTTGGSSTSTSGPPKTASTTAVTDGGTVSVTGTEPSVGLLAVVASPGWSYEISDDGGDRVEVRFERVGGAEVRVRCEWRSGALICDIDG